ncbi:MAG: DNA (cytosine-5-)-methyltransferase [Erysipelotrichaceae bacterium]
MTQINLFEELYKRFTFEESHKVTLFEAFAGVGMQRMAIKRLGVKYESVGISEIDKFAIASYMAIHGDTKNYGSICNITGSQMPSIDIFTYSFPCTDLSKAGKQKGLNQNTRSGLVYEVLRILHELNELNNLPKVLIMENVVDLVQVKFIKQFNEIQFELEQLGYKNYTDVLNAKHYGVAQNRDRVFMVSVLGEFNYEFPRPILLKNKLKDYLEENVDEKYYLSDKLMKYMVGQSSTGRYNRKEVFERNLDPKKEVAATITTCAGNRPTDNFIVDEKSIGGVIIPEATTKGYAIAYDGDSVSLEQPKSKTRRGRVGEKIANTLTTSCNQGVVLANYWNTSEAFTRPPLEELSKTLKCDDSMSVAIPVLTPDRIYKRQNGGRFKNDGEEMFTLTTQDRHGVFNGLRIRKLTPLECWRLMGIDDIDFYKAQEVCSNAQLYKQAGNGIVVNVFAAILGKLF